MFLIKRGENEDIIINENIRVTVAKINNNAVKLGIEAPKEVRIERGIKKKQEN